MSIPIPIVDSLLEMGSGIISRIWPDPADQARELLKLKELAQKGDIAQLQSHTQLLMGQLKINEQEAKSGSFFVAGWRPFVGWVCGFALAYVAILEPIMRFTANMFGYTGEFPIIDTTITMQVLIGMLGLGAYREYGKFKKTDTKKISG